MLGSSKFRQGAWRHPTTTPRCWRRHKGSALLSLLGRVRQGGQRHEGCSPGGPRPCPALLQPGGPPHTPHPGLPSSPASASSLFPSNSAVALPPGSPPDQTTGGRQHIQGQTVGLPPPGDPRALLCSERASCTPALPRGPGPVLIEGPTSWGVIKVAVQTCSCKGQGGGSGRPRFPALRCPRF